MLYIVVALYIEAKPFIKKYNLKKDNSLNKFQIFFNERLKLIISGVGKVKSTAALTYLLMNSKIREGDFIINLGFCASTNPNDNLYDIVLPFKISNAYSAQTYYPDMLYKHSFLEGALICYDRVLESYETNENVYIDMESIGFYESSCLFFKKDSILVIKIVSDILSEKKTDRKQINFNCQDDIEKSYFKIFEFLENLEVCKENEHKFSEIEENLIKKIRQNLKLSDTMYYEFINLLKYLKLSRVDITSFLNIYENIEIKSKLEGKRYFEEIRKKIVE